MVSTSTGAREHNIITTLVEKLRSHHHLLLLTCVRIWCLSLVDQIEQVCLVGCILMADTARRANSIVSY